MKPVNVGNAAERYLAGESAKSIADSLGISQGPVLRHLRELGILRSIRESRLFGKQINEDSIVNRYVSGESEQAIAISLGVSRMTIRPILVSRGIRIRGIQEASALFMAGTTPEFRLQITEAAHAAVRGSTKSDEQLRNSSAAREASPKPSSLEKDVSTMIKSKGIMFIPQKAIGPYNVDIALTESSVAVEILGGHWHAGGYHARVHRQRTDYLLNSGWIPVYVWITKQFPFAVQALDYIIATHETRCSDKSAWSEEHVIRGDGYGGPISKGYPARVPVIPCYKASLDSRSNNLGSRK